jgi:hypothetical protein
LWRHTSVESAHLQIQVNKAKVFYQADIDSRYSLWLYWINLHRIFFIFVLLEKIVEKNKKRAVM